MDLLWIEFLNSDWRDWRRGHQSADRLDTPTWLASFLQRWEISVPSPPTSIDIGALKELRGLMRNMAEGAVEGKRPTVEQLKRLNAVLAEAPMVRVLGDRNDHLQLALIPMETGWAFVRAEIAASFAESLRQGGENRIRICENPDCRWVFYDDTRNRTKRYCDDKVCGNVMKVRRFRSRQRKNGSSQPDD